MIRPSHGPALATMVMSFLGVSEICESFACQYHVSCSPDKFTTACMKVGEAPTLVVGVGIVHGKWRTIIFYSPTFLTLTRVTLLPIYYD
jgi:hypothetical protein